MVEKFEKDEELTEEELEKATGGTDPRQPVRKSGHADRPGPGPGPGDPILTPRVPKKLPGSVDQISPS
jgi:hypothetical protein